MFGFDYKIEIYTPAAKRVYGYYSLPVLMDDALVGRIDLKSDRQAGNLLAQASWFEDRLKTAESTRLAKALAKHLREVQSWQGLSDVVVKPKGNLALELSAHV
jgi:uncharacterized protein YcaQ